MGRSDPAVLSDEFPFAVPLLPGDWTIVPDAAPGSHADVRWIDIYLGHVDLRDCLARRGDSPSSGQVLMNRIQPTSSVRTCKSDTSAEGSLPQGIGS